MRIGLFTTCLADLFAQEAVISTARILRRLGHAVTLPEQTCCGQPAYNSGYPAEARPLLQQYRARFADCDAVVAPSGSCVAMLRHGLREMWPQDDDAGALAARTYELSQFLLDVEGLERPPGRYPGRAVYHASCHLMRWLGVRGAGARLLGGIADLELLDFPDPQLCCGFGGTFAVHFPELSAAMAETKLGQSDALQPDLIVGSDQGCLMQLGGWLERSGRSAPAVLHLASLLDRAGVGQ